MASNSRTFVTGSKTFEITDYLKARGVGNKSYIQSERFTVGGYDWVIEFYPQGINESVSDYVSIFVRLLNAKKQVKAIYSFRFWDWTKKEWSVNTESSSNPETFLPSADRRGYNTYYKRDDLRHSYYFKDNSVKINCTLFVIMPPPELNPNSNEEYPRWSKNSSKYGFHIPGYAPPNAPSNMYPNLPRQPTVRIYCEAIQDFSVTARNGTVVLAPADPSDHYQHWIKDMSNGGTDANGRPTFALVNRVTGHALKTPAGENHEVSLVPYESKSPTNSVNWTEVPLAAPSDFHYITTAGMPILNMTAETIKETKFKDGTKIIVQSGPCSSGMQHWKIIPYDVLRKLIANL